MHIHLQPLGGIAGDMFVAAMLDAFPRCREQVFADIAAVIPGAVGAPHLSDVLRNGIAALHFSLDEKLPAHSHAHAHGHHHHAHEHAPVSDYAGIRRVIESANLSGSTALHALAILEILGRAESHIHRVALEEVHFHELAAWDSLMDVVAAGSVISALGEATWSVSALPLGSGQVKTQHGLLPVPAPATMRILEAYPWRSDDVPGERVTPTGAAIVRYLVPPEHLSKKPEGMLSGGGYGAGTKNFPEMANVLRVMVFDQAQQGKGEGSAVAVLQFDIDDMSGEEIGVAAERLRREKGVLDLLLVAAQGKKGRPVTMFHLLIDPACLDECSRLVFRETSTIGLRWSMLDRIVLPRQMRRSAEGLRLKEVRRPDGSVTAKIESDELESLAGLALRRQTKAAAEGAS
ncbi:MAG: LarC family nickel insertion protein [Burkholderiales bacterium]|nr:LarC family nickel insertion protein [Burkholderiales bacterium]